VHYFLSYPVGTVHYSYVGKDGRNFTFITDHFIMSSMEMRVMLTSLSYKLMRVELSVWIALNNIIIIGLPDLPFALDTSCFINNFCRILTMVY
jgi:hypothetical protein